MKALRDHIDSAKNFGELTAVLRSVLPVSLPLVDINDSSRARTWLWDNFGEPLIVAHWGQLDRMSINLNGTWASIPIGGFMMTEETALLAKLSCSYFGAKNPVDK